MQKQAPVQQSKTSSGSRYDGLWLQAKSENDAAIIKARNMIDNIFEGPMPVFIKYTDTGVRIRYNRTAKIHPLLISELKRILGSENVKVKGDEYRRRCGL